RQPFDEGDDPPFALRRQIQVQHGAATIPGNRKYARGNLLILPRRVNLPYEGSVQEVPFIRTEHTAKTQRLRFAVIERNVHHVLDVPAVRYLQKLTKRGREPGSEQTLD